MMNCCAYEERFWSKVDKTNSCWEWKGSVRNRYGSFNYKGKQWRAHRLSFKLAHGAVSPKRFICHTCDNPLCVNPSHLWAGSSKSNSRDKVEKERCFKGYTSPYQGVNFHHKSNRWRAYTSRNGKKIQLGTFSTEEKAHEAYQGWKQKDPRFYFPETKDKRWRPIRRRQKFTVAPRD